jgi:hypothetical protein
MARQFDVTEETSEILETSSLTVGQRAKAEAHGCTRWFRLDRDTKQLPQYIRKAADDAGFVLHLLGWTTFSTSTWGLSPKKRM